MTVHLFRAAADGNSRPRRAIGLTWIGLDPAARKLDVAFDTPEKRAPRGTSDAVIRTAPGALVSLAAVDEGILRLTSFPSPDPAAHYPRPAHAWAWTSATTGAADRAARRRGHRAAPGRRQVGMMPPDDPEKTVRLFSPPMQAGADGTPRHPARLGDFAGQVRLMAVAWQGRRIGSGQRRDAVRDPLVAERCCRGSSAPAIRRG